MWFTPASFRRYDTDNLVVEEFASHVTGRGMHYQAAALHRLIHHEPESALTPADSVGIMETTDEVRREVGLRYPCE